MSWDRSLDIFKKDLKEYLESKPKELVDQANLVVKSREFQQLIQHSLNNNHSFRNMVKFYNMPAPFLKGSFTWKIDSVLEKRDLFSVEVIKVAHNPTFWAKVEVEARFDILLSYWAKGKQKHTVGVEAKIPIYIDLRFSDEINDLYFDYLSDI
tara:strand:+ start:710 stop:1168 length:459 start_codon:yes stop_codon:yes gene_type:complete